MTFPKPVQIILDHLNLKHTQPIGKGGEGWVFHHTPDTVLKIYIDTNKNRLINRQEIYDLLNQYTFSFQTPDILEIHTHKNICYTIEKKLPGKPGNQTYHLLNTNARHHVLQSYFNAIAELNQVDVSNLPFGDIIPDENAITSSTWTDYLIQKLDQRLNIARNCLTRDIPDLTTRVENLKQRIHSELSCDQKALVHGDYFLGNLMIDESSTVSAIFDFSTITVVGDARMDMASALLFLTLAGGDGILKFEPDYDFAKSFVIQKYGDQFQTYIDIYVLYYGIYFADSGYYAPDLYAWCLNILRT